MCATLPEGLAVPASPLAVDVAVHEELGWHHIQSLRDVFTDALHGAPAALFLAVGVVGLMAMLHATQVCRVGPCDVSAL